MEPLQKGGHVYIMTNKNHTVLYIGVTSNLKQRTLQHKTHFYKYSFTAKYNCEKLVWYKAYNTIKEANIEEKKLKDRSRKYKESLINAMNPDWNDLWEIVEQW